MIETPDMRYCDQEVNLGDNVIVKFLDGGNNKGQFLGKIIDITERFLTLKGFAHLQNNGVMQVNREAISDIRVM